MFQRVQIGRPSSGTVIAFIALAIALQGRASAGTTIDGSQITPGTITSLQLQDKGIKAADLADKSVSSGKLGDGAVTSVKIGDGAVTSADIATKAITTALLGDHAVTNINMAGNSVTSSTLAKGAVTPADIAALPTLIASHPGVGSETTALPYFVPFSDVSVKLQFTANGANTVYTATKAGLYHIDAAVNWGQDPTQNVNGSNNSNLGSYTIYLIYGNGGDSSHSAHGEPNGGQGAFLSVSAEVTLAPGDTIQVLALRDIVLCGQFGVAPCQQRFGTTDSNGDNTSFLTVIWDGPSS